MEAIKYLNNAIEYIEENLETTIEFEEIAKVACTSRYHFQRLFHGFTGFTLAEYIRNRRLTLAAEELHSEGIKITDLAFKYGYISVDAFTKAFQRLHGVTPSKVKKGNIMLKSFPKLTLQITVTGGCDMNYRIVDMDEFKVFGVAFQTSVENGALYYEIPEFCDKVWEDGTHYRINQLLGYPRMHMLHGIHYDFNEDGSRKYMMGWEVADQDIAEEYEILDVLACSWAVFEGKGVMPEGDEIQNIWKRVYSEWFPSSGFEQTEGPCIEKYYWDDEKYEAYTCEVWIPVKRKAQS